jgi:hypothetical protein
VDEEEDGEQAEDEEHDVGSLVYVNWHRRGVLHPAFITGVSRPWDEVAATYCVKYAEDEVAEVDVEGSLIFADPFVDALRAEGELSNAVKAEEDLEERIRKRITERGSNMQGSGRRGIDMSGSGRRGSGKHRMDGLSRGLEVGQRVFAKRQISRRYAGADSSSAKGGAMQSTTAEETSEEKNSEEKNREEKNREEYAYFPARVVKRTLQKMDTKKVVLRKDVLEGEEADEEKEGEQDQDCVFTIQWLGEGAGGGAVEEMDGLLGTELVHDPFDTNDGQTGSSREEEASSERAPYRSGETVYIKDRSKFLESDIRYRGDVRFCVPTKILYGKLSGRRWEFRILWPSEINNPVSEGVPAADILPNPFVHLQQMVALKQQHKGMESTGGNRPGVRHSREVSWEKDEELELGEAGGGMVRLLGGMHPGNADWWRAGGISSRAGDGAETLHSWSPSPAQMGGKVSRIY